MENEQTFKTVEEYQSYLKERQQLLAYCKKIQQGIENLDERSGERAIWELVQNARDLDDNCRIRIELQHDRLIFSHHGKAFDYMSLLALVNQNSSKDNPGADIVGKYGTGFMTTHAFNDVVKVDGPYKVMCGPNVLLGYVDLGEDFKLNRSFCHDNCELEDAIREMRTEMKKVDEMHLRKPIHKELPDKWTSFTYDLDTNAVKVVSSQLEGAIRFMPFVLTINTKIEEVEVIDVLQNKHYHIRRIQREKTDKPQNNSNWKIIDTLIEYTHEDNPDPIIKTIKSLQGNESKDIIILPPYPDSCGSVFTIPSLFLSFPLLGTELFGVNFIFHSKRFHPVEKRNNIMLPENVPSKLAKGKANEAILREMMNALFSYYSIENNDKTLNRDMCYVNFHSEKDDDVMTKFFVDLQDLWKSQVPKWEVIPTADGKKSMNDTRVRVLHPDFYKRLSTEKKKEYESTLILFAQQVKYDDQNYYLLPVSDLIAWSETVNQWNCKRDDEFYISVKDVCKSIKNKSDYLHAFLSFLKDSENLVVLDDYELLPNRQNVLRKKGDLRHGDFMSAELYSLTELLMGSDASKMIDTTYNDIVTVGSYQPEDLQRAIGQTVSQWRKNTLGDEKIGLTEAQLNALITFCSASSLPEFTNYRGRMMKHIVRFYNKTFSKVEQKKLIDREDDFYDPAFNLLLDYTLFTISKKDSTWVKANLPLLNGFLTEYATSKAAERLSRLDEYAVIPNQKFKLCFKKELHKNVNINEQLAKFSLDFLNQDLQDYWVHEDFKDIFTYNEQKASEIAKDIQDKLSDDNYQDSRVLDIIELAEDEKIDEWKILFKTIYAQRESIRYRLGSDEERKAINRMMKKKDPVLLKKMAEVAEHNDARVIIDKVNDVINQMKHEAYIDMLGAYVETHIQRFLSEALAVSCITVLNKQGGQDFILMKSGYEDYHVEVKSRWENDQSVEMTSTQFSVAVTTPNRYALVSVNMYHFDRSRAEKNEQIELDEIYENINCLDNIGTLVLDLKKRTDEAFRGTEKEIHLNGSYTVRVPQDIFRDNPLDFNGLIERIKRHFGG